jgi:hypothetical protein
VEVAVARGGEERIDERALLGEVGVFVGGGAAHAPAGAAGELARGAGGRADDGSDLRERHGEHVVQDEGEALGGRE